MGNPAIPVQIGVSDVDTILDTGNSDVTASGVSQAPSTNATWTKLSSGVEATLATALADAGYITIIIEYASGTKSTSRIPTFTTA